MAQSDTSIDPSKVKWDDPIDPSKVKWETPESPAARSLNIAAEVPRTFIRNAAAGGVKSVLEALQPSQNMLTAMGLPKSPIPGRIAEAISYQPKYPETSAGMNLVGTPGRLYGEMAKGAGQKVESLTGSPTLGLAAQKGIEIAPYGIGRAPVSPVSEAATAARAAGFRLSPLEQGAGGQISRTMATISGEPRLARLVSQKNVGLVTEKIAEDLGLPKDIPITKEAIRGVRAAAGDVYKEMKGTGTVFADAQYATELANIQQKFLPAAMELGGSKTILNDLKNIGKSQFSAAAAVDRITQLRESASTAFRNGASSEGAAYRAMAEAIEAKLGRHLVSVNAPQDVLTKFQNARVTLAKAHMAEEALDAATGKIKAGVYGAAAREGKPLTGLAKEVGEAAGRYPRSFQSPGIYQGTGPAFGDIALGMAQRVVDPTAIAEAALTVGARPALRGLLSSSAGQSLAGVPLLPQFAYGLAPGLLNTEYGRKSP
jgi:hypothetical protein